MRTALTLALLAALAPAAAAQEKLPPGAKLVAIEAWPRSVELKHPHDYAQLLLTGVLDTGDRVDVTRLAKLAAPPAVKASAAGLLRPAADGVGEVVATLDGREARVPVKVGGLSVKYEAGFVRDVQPALSKMGCNQGTCHGAAQGKVGFKLSLRGYDPLEDYRALTDDLEGRRFNRAAPDRSLMLLKPSGVVPHVGGVLCQPGEPYYELLRSWIADGVRFDPSAPRVVGIEVQPQGPVVPLPGMRQQTAVLARYADGTVRDVTAEAFVESSNTEVATVDKAGLVTAVRRGEATMLARYEGAYAASTLVVMGDRTGFRWAEPPANNHIDTLVYEKLKRVKVLPSGLCGDAEFVRRVYLDLTGLPPTPEEVKAFVADGRDTRLKRDELIDRLVGGPAFVEHWTNKWADLLQVNRKFLGEKGAAALRAWVRQAVAANTSYDKFVYEILTGSGSTADNPPAAYWKVLREPDAVMENTTHLFLAIRFNCNKCHDHPFERWTQDQYYQMAAFFAQVGRKEDPNYRGQKIGGSAVEGAKPLVEVVRDTGAGEVKHERTGATTPPKFPYDHKDAAPATAARREQLARWVTSKENPYFAKSFVNRVWSYLLGVGLIEPVDDIRAGNPPTNPALLDRLTADFVASGFDVQQLMRTVCKSRVYQHAMQTNEWNADDEINYSHAVARRLPAEVLYDAIHRAAGSRPNLPGLPPGGRAAQLLDSSVPVPGGFLELFGKPVRESACECERSTGVMLGPVLNLVNGPVIGDALRDPNNRIAKLVAAETDDGKVVDELFVAVLCRKPTGAERKAGVEAIRSARGDFDRLVAEHARAEAELRALEAKLPERQAAWERTVTVGPEWVPLAVASAKAKGKGVELKAQPDGSVTAAGPNPSPEVYTVTAKVKLAGLSALRLEALADPALPAGGPGRAPNGNFVLNELKLSVAPAGDPAKTKPAGFKRAVATFSQDNYEVAKAIDGNRRSGWAVSPQFGKTHTAVFELSEAVPGDEELLLTVTLDQQYEGKDHNLGKFRLSATSAKGPILLESSLPPAVLQALRTPADKRTPQQKDEAARYYRTQDPDLARLTKAVGERPQPPDHRLIGAQDLAWALMNSPAFLFNH